jgi:hypothetical protein
MILMSRFATSKVDQIKEITNYKDWHQATNPCPGCQHQQVDGFPIGLCQKHMKDKRPKIFLLSLF